ncbi:hypothetical protein AB0D11_29310 [Streptomyces monashensis]|uniref:hypothetical protein n=1 Tax=Streptomyces monashensis TaxID=1678012 RepID=UPI0033EF5501
MAIIAANPDRISPTGCGPAGRDVRSIASIFARCSPVRYETRLCNALDERLREQHGIVTSQFESLRHLREHPGS